jgi:hypothetical protein
LKKVPGDLISLTITCQVSEFVAMISSGYFFSKLGPKYGHALALALSATGSLMLLFFWTSNSPRIILCLVIIAYFGMVAAINMIFITWMLLIPTILNATAFGYVNIVARTFNSFSSLIAEADYRVSISYNIFCCIISIVAAFLLVTK